MRVTLKGHKELRRDLEKYANPAVIKTIVQKNGDELNARMKKQTEVAFVKGYSTGQTARSINTIIKDGGFTADVGPTTEYSPYVEYGTRFMQAEPFVAPAFEAQSQKFIHDLERIVE